MDFRVTERRDRARYKVNRSTSPGTGIQLHDHFFGTVSERLRTNFPYPPPKWCYGPPDSTPLCSEDGKLTDRKPSPSLSRVTRVFSPCRLTKASILRVSNHLLSNQIEICTSKHGLQIAFCNSHLKYFFKISSDTVFTN